MNIIDIIIKKIKTRMKELNISQTQLAADLGYSVQYVSDMFRRVRGGLGSIETLEKISKYLDVPISYFLSDIQSCKSPVAEQDNDIYYDYIKFYDVKVSAGSGIPAENESTRLLPVERSFITRLGYPSDMLSAVEVMGDSMEPTLRNGDYVIIHRPEYTADFVPGIYVIRDFSGLKVKRLDMDKFGNLNVISDNKCYNPQEYTQDEISSEVVKIIGRVLGKIGIM